MASNRRGRCRVRTAKEGEDLDAIKEKTEALSKAVQKIGEHMSAQGAADSKGDAGGGDAGSGSEGSKASGG